MMFILGFGTAIVIMFAVKNFAMIRDFIENRF
jgi:hypothetical protein